MPRSRQPSNGPHWEAVLAFGDQSTVFAGVDEVGRGAWAGPVVAAAVVLPYGIDIPDVNDSKLLSHQRRVAADRLIRSSAVAIGIGWIHATEVDQIGLTQSVIRASQKALAQIEADFDAVLLDGSHNFLQDSHNSFAMVKGDAHLPQVAAASIIAKVARDRYMAQLDVVDGTHKFAEHKGYGTAAHTAALAKHGVTRHHRLSYKPLRKYLDVD